LKVIKTEMPGLLIIEPDIFKDSRGFFMETWNAKRYAEAGLDVNFVQDNLSFSSYGVLRGLHYQQPSSQGKLVYVIHGSVYDVAVDIRVGSPSFGHWYGLVLSADNRKQFYIPEGFAHGYCVLSETALFAYKCTDFYSPANEGGIAWDDPDLGIDWPVANPILSDKDTKHPLLRQIDLNHLPQWSELHG
jgi:dTDP-4-dehydrorhamnose 3,5-epimerase